MLPFNYHDKCAAFMYVRVNPQDIWEEVVWKLDSLSRSCLTTLDTQSHKVVVTIVFNLPCWAVSLWRPPSFVNSRKWCFQGSWKWHWKNSTVCSLSLPGSATLFPTYTTLDLSQLIASRCPTCCLKELSLFVFSWMCRVCVITELHHRHSQDVQALKATSGLVLRARLESEAAVIQLWRSPDITSKQMSLVPHQLVRLWNSEIQG